MNIKYLSIIFSVVGIIILYFLSTLSQPVLIDINKIPEYEGQQVIIEGIVTEYYTTGYGSQIITIENKNSTTTVFVEEKTEVEYGDKIQATGEVQKYGDGWEVVVKNLRFISIIEKWHNISIPLSQLAKNPTKYENLNVNVTGVIDSVYDKYFILADQNETHSILVFYKSSDDITFFPGQKANVIAKFYYDAENLRFKLIMENEAHSIFTYSR